jgi:hypothetical protein
MRPNILLFGDHYWISERVQEQERRFREFLRKNKEKGITILEFGAGSFVPTIRMASESIFCDIDAKRAMVRVNTEPGEPSLYGVKYHVINEHNIDQQEKFHNENEFFEMNISTQPAMEQIYEAVRELAHGS